MSKSKRYVYIDSEQANSDWPKSSYDLTGVETLSDLAKFVRMSADSREFRIWLRNANNYPWVDNAPTEIRLAIRAHKNFAG